MKGWIYILSVVFGVTACGGLHRHSAISYRKMSEVSKIKIPVSINQADLEREIARIIPDTLFEGGEREGLPVHIRVYKGGYIGLSMRGDVLEIEFPMEVKMIKRLGFLTATADGAIVMNLRSKVDFDSTWHLRTRTVMEGYRWVKEPKINMMGFHLKVGSWSEDYIDSHQAVWMSTLDERLAEMDDVHDAVEVLVNQFRSPLTPDSSSVFGWDIQPSYVGLYPFHTEAGVIGGALEVRFDMGIKDIRAFSSEIEGENAKGRPLPVFQWEVGAPTPQVNILAITLKRGDIQNMVDHWLGHAPREDRTLEVRGKEIMISQVEVVTQKNRIGAKVYFEGGQKGRLEFTAAPQWNAKSQRVELREEKVDLRMKGLKSRLALFLFKRKVRHLIHQSIEGGINARLIEGVGELEEVLNEQVEGQLHISEYALDPIQVQHELLLLDVRIRLKGYIDVGGVGIEILHE